MTITEADITEEQEQRFKNVQENFQTLHGFVMVLAIGNVIRQFAGSQIGSSNNSPSPVNIVFNGDEFWSSLIVLILIVRFFLGDRTLIKNYKAADSKSIFSVDMVNILVSSFALAYVSFFVTYPAYAYCLVALLMLSEIVWWIIRNVIKWTLIITNYFTKSTINLSARESHGVDLAQLVSLVTIAFLLFYSRDNIDLNNLGSWVNLTFTAENLLYLKFIFLANMVGDLICRGPYYLGFGFWEIKRS